MDVLDTVKDILSDTLGVNDRLTLMSPRAPLLGAVPELDSMAVVSVITAIEERFGFIVADDEINAKTFQSIASLATFVEEKIHP